MIIDSHQHFWTYRPERDTWITPEMETIRRDFYPEDLLPIQMVNKIEGCIAVQADSSEKETDFLIKCAREHSFVKGVVGWTDLRSPQLQARLEYYHEFSEIKGFRHIVQSEPDGFLLDDSFCRGIAQLEQYSFTYDILVYPKQLPEVLQFVKKFPRQKFVIDHLAKPLIREKKLEPWRQLMKEIAQHDNVYCKISGLVTEAEWKAWRPTDFTPFQECVLEAFGPRRLLYGSDWPVCLVAASYEEQFTLTTRFISGLSPTEKKSVMGGNATSFYQL
jgi:L-fuconolactonase